MVPTVTPPSTAAAGGQGAFGSYNPTAPGATPLSLLHPPAYGGNYNPSVNTPSQLYNSLQRPNAAYSNLANPNYNSSVSATLPTTSVSPQGFNTRQKDDMATKPTPTNFTTANSFGTDAATFYVMQRIANGESVSPAEAQAAAKLLGVDPSLIGATNAGGEAPRTPDQWAPQYSDGSFGRARAGNADFAGTGFAQYNAANNVAFTNQQRWDPERKQYVKIGQLIREGRLDVKDKKARLKRSKRGRQEYSEQTAAQSTSPAGFTGSLGVVNFNTGTG
jgi:hypothetical protein